jgi:uncharacterized DUF497 family protein
MSNISTSQKIAEKLAARGITLEDCKACFGNRTGKFLEDTRPQHQTVPPTYWFIAEDNKGRTLKVAFVYYPIEDEVHIKSAYEPEQPTKDFYNKHGTK